MSRSEHPPGLYCLFLLGDALDLRFGEQGIGIGGANGAAKRHIGPAPSARTVRTAGQAAPVGAQGDRLGKP
ncbi:hypothetical protein [Pseudogemmobacter sonorensis]|uniref:hypothetical protein n=1 Tax=Pseudogemmobacter sonorensis TaxID=2989681 RepID=UPI00367387BF